jgi:hypothetical protein
MGSWTSARLAALGSPSEQSGWFSAALFSRGGVGRGYGAGLTLALLGCVKTHGVSFAMHRLHRSNRCDTRHRTFAFLHCRHALDGNQIRQSIGKAMHYSHGRTVEIGWGCSGRRHIEYGIPTDRERMKNERGGIVEGKKRS